MLQTVYREIDFDDEQMARQQRDAHLAELQAQGMVCVAENLYNALDGWRVFTLVATPATTIEETARSRPSTSSRSNTVPAPQPSVRSKLKRSVPQKPQPDRLKRTYEVR